ncbi:hypothetical protein TWF696_008713 [Orbilia brochopaga]|uniref:Uncharacterized protein n=1 Tax=Orbilia brochopaga TaxID=3140254 RepID=A0AAV9UJV9_9PEZI
MSVLRNFFEKQLGQEYAVLSSRLRPATEDACQDRRYMLDLVLKDGRLSHAAITILQFAQSVLDFTGEDLDICSWIFEELKATNLKELASNLFPRSHLDEKVKSASSNASKKLTALALGEIRSKFFDREQLLVMLVLLQSGNFTIPDDQKVIAKSILLSMIDDNIDINEPRLIETALQKVTNEIGRKPSENDLKASLDFVKTIILLCRVVEEPEDVAFLHKAGFESARQIAQKNKEDFSSQMVKVGMEKKSALKVHDCAERLNCWNEQLWLSLMQSRREDFIPVSTARPTDVNSGKLSGRPLNNLTDIFKLEDSECEECCSVTSLSAYLADLLLLLRNTEFAGRSTPKNLLEILFHRRPDIRKLELSCANSQTLLPYISLVNEVLESYIRSIAEPPIAPSDRFQDSIRAYQTPPGFEEDENSPAGLQYRPANTDYAVYRKKISQPMHPFTCFPYDLSLDIQKSVFSTWQLEFAKFLRYFQSPEQLLNLVPADRQGQPGDELHNALLTGAIETLERQLAAAEIGLQPTEFAAITNETFFPGSFADLVNGLSSVPLKIDKTCEDDVSNLWGYDDAETMLDPKSGLSLIKNQLMLKSGLEFQDIVDLVKTRCFGQHLVITDASGSQHFGTYIEGLRLLSSAAAPPFQPLTEKLALNLQSFMRLQAKLKWSTADIDAAIVSFRGLELSISTNIAREAKPLPPPADKTDLQANPSEIISISPFVIKGIASLLRLSNLSDIEPANLLPLWAPIDTYGDKSLFHREFMTRRFQQIDKIFELYGDAKKGSAQYLTVGGNQTDIADHSRGICAALSWPPAYFDQLTSVADCAGKKLDIDTFSALYRHAIICRILSVPPKNCKAFFDVFFAQSGAFVLSNPQSTVAAIEDWKLLLDSGWDVESLIDVFGKQKQTDEKKIKEANDAGLKLALAIAAGAKDLAQSVPYTLPQAAAPSAADVVDCASRLFDESVAQAVVDLVEDSKQLPEALSKRFPFLKQLDDAIRQSATGDPAKANGVFMNGHDSGKANGVSANGHAPKDQDEEAAEEAEKKRLAAEKAKLVAIAQQQKRRSTFIKLATPTILEDLNKIFLVKTVKEFLPDIEPPVILTLLSDLISISTPDGQSKQSALLALQYFKEPANDAITAEKLDAYFNPPSSECFTLSYSGSSTSPTISIDGLDIPYDHTSKSFTTFRLIAGKFYRLRASFGAKDITWSTPKTASNTFDAKSLTSASIAIRAALIISAIKRVAGISQTIKFTPEELQYIVLNQRNAGNNLVVDLNNLSLDDLVRLEKYKELRKRSSDTPSTLIGLIVWLSTASPADVNTIAAKFSDSTGWKQARVAEALQANFPGLSSKVIVEKLRNFKKFLEFTDILAFDDELENACTGGALPSISGLFELAKPRLSLTVSDADFEKAIALQNGLTPSQKNDIDVVLSQNRRKVLVEYLLQHEEICEEQKISDADGLFELFLIDVQMGPQLRTSRIKQAISVVQLFVQRCLLGMEDNVPKNMLPRDKWSWMQHYNIWEAHRKMFLYPENWLEPSLRDDKSPLFEQLETVLMQKDLSISTFIRAIQDYVYDLNGISSLDIVAYLHEPHPGAEDIFHVFGRTRTAPHTFYYRTLTVYHPEETVFWKPWVKMDLDIPSVETDWDSKRLKESGSYLAPVLQEDRLYIFFPQVMVKTVNPTQSSTPATAGKTWNELGGSQVTGQEPITSWEITMAWSEYVKGTWSPKRISAGSLNIDPKRLPNDKPNIIPPYEKLPSAWEFRVDPVFEKDSFKLVISHAPITAQVGTVIGAFNFSRDQVISIQDGAIKVPPSQFSTYFGKVRGENSTLYVPGTEDDKKKPLVWLPKGLDSKQADVKWTLSKAPQRTTGLVLNVKQDNGSSISYFNVPEKELLDTAWTQEVIASRMSLKAMDHFFSQSLMQAAVNRVDPLGTIYNTMSATPPKQLPDTYGWSGGSAFYHELASPCALYNWELGVHSIMLAVDRFFTTQQYEEALQVARLLFDPTVDLDVHRDGDPKPVGNAPAKPAHPQSCWRFPPFQDIGEHIDQSGDAPPDLKKLGTELQLAIKDRRSYGQLVHAAARGRPQAYMKWIIMKYAEILLAAGDEYFRQATLESLPWAIQRYIEASRVLGPEPVKGLKIGRKDPLCFDAVLEDEVRVNLALPFSPQLKKGAASARETDPKKEIVRSFIMTPYFCVPLNPKFKKLRSLVHERLFNIRNSLDINGKPVVYALREPPIDPSALIALGSVGGSLSSDLAIALGNQNGPLTRYRFEMRLNRAFELCNELRALAERFISAVERKEGEELNCLRARNATIIQNIILGIKQTQLTEAQQTLESLTISRNAQVAQLSYYLESIGESTSLIPSSTQDWTDLKQDIGPITKDDLRMSTYEKSEMDLTTAASNLNLVAAGIDSTAQMFAWMPSISGNIAPLGVGTSVTAGGSNITAAIQIGAMAMRNAATIVSESSNEAGRKGRMAKQLQEKRLQANIKGREIKATDKQIEIQKIRITAAQKDIDSQRASMEDAAQTEAYYRSKYTNQQLYAWMEKELRNVYFQAYALTVTAAQQAESALSFEQGRKINVLKPAGYWNASRDGLLAADNLYLDLKRLESAHLDTKKWDYEITKTVSLRQIDPLALMRLRVTGSTEFSLSELQYDMDFPGHYMRRIRSVSVSIPAVVSPYSSLNATLTMTKNQYRINTTVSTAKDYLTPNADSLRTDRIPVSSIAISSGSNDTGVFELSFAGSKYLPFEGAGAISSWKLSLPTEVRKFDYATISDVLLHVQYTSLDGGECLRATANDAVRSTAKAIEAEGKSQGFYAMFDLKNDFVNAWHGFSSHLLSSYKATKTAKASMELGDIKERLPFWSRSQKKLIVKSIALISSSPKLVRGISIPAATGEGPTIDESRLGDGKSTLTVKTLSGFKQDKLDGWSLEASGAVIGEKDTGVENVYMLIQYFFG